MFVHKVFLDKAYFLKGLLLTLFFQSAVKDNESGKMVKFGYVVFAEKGVSQKVLKDGQISFQGNKIAVKEMKN